MSILAGGAAVGFALLGRTDLSLFTIGLSFLSRLQLVDAFSTSFTPAVSCGSFTVNWNATAEQSIGPPFSLLIVPVNNADAPSDTSAGRGPSGLSPPIRLNLPDSVWNAASRSGTHTIDQLPLRAGERFIVAMDDGFGYGTGGVSLIQRVEISGAQTASCLPDSSANSNVFFSIGSFSPAQCSPLSILVNSPIEVRGFVPGGSPFSLDMPASTSGNATILWSVNVATGSSFVLLYRAQNGDIATSGLMETTAAGQFGDECLVNAPHTQTSNGAQSVVSLEDWGFLLQLLSLPFSSSFDEPTLWDEAAQYPLHPASKVDRMTSTRPMTEARWAEGLEGRFGGKLFGGGKKKGANGSGSGGNMRTYTSSQRRAIYPGLSIASTQNQSIGLVTLDEPTHDVQMNPMPPLHQASNPKTGNSDPNRRYQPAAVERVQNEAMS
ncbi:7795_t:CDS:2, partial [Acaulospora colombiana]